MATKVRTKPADIIFLIDATGSMNPGIDAVKRHIGYFVTSLVNPSNPNVASVKDWRIAIYAYRDYEYDGPDKWFVANPFSRDLDTVLRQLEALHAEGGGDEPESLLDALMAIGKIDEMSKDVCNASEEDTMKWRHISRAARFVVVLTDARFHYTIPSVPGALMDDLKDTIANARIRLSIFAPEFQDFNGYEELAFIDKTIYNPVPLNDSSPVEALASFCSSDSNFNAALRDLSVYVCKSCSCACHWH